MRRELNSPDQSHPTAPSEFLLNLGQTIELSRKKGLPIIVEQNSVATVAKLMRLANEFNSAPSSVKLRALVEDWNFDQIHEALDESKEETVQPVQP